MNGEPLLPPIHEDARPFWEGTRAGELRIPRCPETGRLFFPPRPRSPFAPHREPEWARVSGRGRIWSFVVPHPPLLPPFSERAPYNVVAVALDEDPTIRLVGNLLAREGGGIEELAPAAVRIGTAVRVVFERASEQITLPRWVRTEPG